MLFQLIEEELMPVEQARALTLLEFADTAGLYAVHNLKAFQAFLKDRSKLMASLNFFRVASEPAVGAIVEKVDGEVIACSQHLKPVVVHYPLSQGERAFDDVTASLCRDNLKNVGSNLELYSVDFGGRYPPSLGYLTPKYLRALPPCPAVQKFTYDYRVNSRADLFTVTCHGANHRGQPANFPQYNSTKGLVEAPHKPAK